MSTSDLNDISFDTLDTMVEMELISEEQAEESRNFQNNRNALLERITDPESSEFEYIGRRASSINHNGIVARFSDHFNHNDESFVTMAVPNEYGFTDILLTINRLNIADLLIGHILENDECYIINENVNLVGQS